MTAETQDRAKIFMRAWEIIQADERIPADEKEGILKLIQALIEAAQTNPAPARKSTNVRSITQEVISKHALMSLVKQQADELDSLKRLSLNLTSSLDLHTVLDSVVSEAMRLVKNARTAHIFLYIDSALEFGASLDQEGVRNKLLAVPRPNGLTNTVAKSGERMIVENIEQSALYKDSPPAWHGSIIGIPLKFGNSIVGVMNLSRSIVGEFTSAELRLLGLLADQAAVAISNASIHQQVTEEANTDTVTGLPNRRSLDERLQEEIQYARQKSSQFAVVMMDLDGFKAVNDTYGHSFGDELLNSVFNFLARGMRNTDFLARYGGDELTLIIRDASVVAAKTVAEKIIKLIATYSFTTTSGTELKLGLTAGIAAYPFHARNAGDLLRAADSALYHAKKHYRGSFVVAQSPSGPLGAVTIPREHEE